MSSASKLARALGAKKSGSGWIARCPAHKDRTPSFSITDAGGVVLFHCHAGCSQQTVITALRARGLWAGEPCNRFTPGESYAPDRAACERMAIGDALAIWDNAAAAKGTLAEAYLRARGIRRPMSDQLRYVPRLKHSPSGRSFPAMIARLADERGFCAIQRTYLDPSVPKKADVMPNKMSKGPMKGAAVRLSIPIGPILGLAEGIETALSAWQLYSLPVWATCGISRLHQIEIPPTIQHLVIFGDPGKQARLCAFDAADHYERAGLAVEVIFPASDFAVSDADDFNDVLRKRPVRA